MHVTVHHNKSQYITEMVENIFFAYFILFSFFSFIHVSRGPDAASQGEASTRTDRVLFPRWVDVQNWQEYKFSEWD